jgi:hypothetical protein
VTLRNAPLLGRDGESYTTDLPFRKIRIFFQKGLDTSQTQSSSDLPDGQITCGKRPPSWRS